MLKPNAAAEPELGPQPQPDEPKRRATKKIKFPHYDLDEAADLAATVYNLVGPGDCELEDLAPRLGSTVNSSAFRMKVSAAKMYSVIENQRGPARLSPIGRAIVDENTSASARVDAFLAVPLFQKLYDQFKGGVQLPADEGLESAIQELGVSKKNAQRARQVFRRSAQQAGFFAQGANRLVRPAGTRRDDVTHAPSVDTTAERSNNGDAEPSLNGWKPEGTPGMQADPVLAGLFEKLPAAGKGNFPRPERESFTNALAALLDLVYGPADSAVTHEQALEHGGHSEMPDRQRD